MPAMTTTSCSTYIPLSGNYEVQCDLIDTGLHFVDILLAGTYAGVGWDVKNLDVGTFRSGTPKQPIDPPLTSFGSLVRYRGVVRDGTRTIYLNGRRVVSGNYCPTNRIPGSAFVRGSGRRAVSRIFEFWVQPNRPGSCSAV